MSEHIHISLDEATALRKMLYRLLERHGADPDVLSIVGSLFDTLPVEDVIAIGNDWLATGQTIHEIQ